MMHHRSIEARMVALGLLLLMCAPAGAADVALPRLPVAAPPFPAVADAQLEREFVAPGVTQGRYHLQTAAGPIVISFVTIDPKEPSVRLGAVEAGDRLISNGERVSAMAERTGAIAGINADYYDIGNTNQPLGVLVRNGMLVRTPSRRVALTVTQGREVRFETYRFAGTVRLADGSSTPLGAVNEWPPAGASPVLLTPAFGALAPNASITLARLQPLNPAALSGSYRVLESGPLLAGYPRAPYALAYGANAASSIPAAGDTIALSADTDPGLADIAQAVGGGPLLLRDGLPFDDLEGPAVVERTRRIPIAAAARFPSGALMLIAVDGRRPLVSIGMSRVEMAAFCRALGATDAMSFDSGGSATLVARVLGERTISLRNTPSDGVERAVADGLFVYSDALVGPPARLVVHPAAGLALPGARVALTIAETDAAGHLLHGGIANGVRISASPAELATLGGDGTLLAGARPASGNVHLSYGALHADVPFAVLARPDRLTIAPALPNPDPGASVTLQAIGLDAVGRNIALGEVRWTSAGGTVSPAGVFRAGVSDATVTASVGAASSTQTIKVGRHSEPLPLTAANAHWAFASLPAREPGSVAINTACPGCLGLNYDLTSARASYANADLPVGSAQSLSVDIEGDASGVGLRAAFVNTLGERTAVTLAKSVDWQGFQRRTVRLDAASGPLRLVSLYVVGSLGGAPVHATGTLTFRNATLIVPGSARPAP